MQLFKQENIIYHNKVLRPSSIGGRIRKIRASNFFHCPIPLINESDEEAEVVEIRNSDIEILIRGRTNYFQ